MSENSQVDEEFHEETPQEFAAQPDRDFAKFRPADTPGEKESDSRSPSPSSGSQQQDDRQKKGSDGQ